MENISKIRIIILLGLLFISLACTNKNGNDNNNSQQEIKKSEAKNIKENIIQYKIKIIDSIPHSTESYTQGFEIYQNKLFEGTGEYGKSKLYMYDLTKSNNKKNNLPLPIRTIELPQTYFGEGITILNDKIFQLTWLNQICIVYDLKTMKKEKELSYSGEGWGLANNDSLLLLSDGSATIRFINPSNFETISNLRITRNNNPVKFLNEIELVDDLLYANIYMQDLIVIADIKTGKVVGEIDISELRHHLFNNPAAEVSNGIAYDKNDKKFYLTGKNWNKIFIVVFEK
jgi:glutamine cyclotransferase